MGATVSLNAKNLVLRGARLKNCKWIYGLVVYTGQDTKIMKNSDEARTKSSKVERDMN